MLNTTSQHEAVSTCVNSLFTLGRFGVVLSGASVDDLIGWG